MTAKHSDVAIVGAGPVGLELAVALKGAGIDYIQFDKGQIGQTISWFPRMMRFFSSPDRIAIAGVPIPGVDESKCTREEYLAYLRSIVLQFDLPVHTYEEVTTIKRVGEEFNITTETKGEMFHYYARSLVLAIGDMHKPRVLNIPGENLPHVDHYFDEPHKYFRRKILVVGGRNSAVEAALRCYRCGAAVSLSHRGDEFDPSSIKYWILPEIQGLTERGEIQVHRKTVPKAIHNSSVTLAQVDGGRTFDVDADFVLLMVGYLAEMLLFRMAGVTLEKAGEKPVYNERTMETNIPGLYVAGTATAGTQQTYTVFIENCHVHVKRILAALSGAPSTDETGKFERPES